LADAVVVATDSSEIANAVTAAGGRSVLTSAAHPSGTDRIAEVAQFEEFAGFHVILNVQGDEPFVAESAIRGSLAMVTERGFALGTAASPANEAAIMDPNVVKVVSADDGRALYFSRASIPWLRDGADRNEWHGLIRQHIGVYAYTRAALLDWVALPVHPLERVERLEQLRPLAAGMRMGVALVDTPPVGGIDTEADLQRANAHWTDLYAGRT
jgi:3-deoxy-manno-octulosonate cytidylyltransferase (CMP-KDO synthetase)